MTKDQPKNPDYPLLIIVSCLLVLGVLILSSASAILSQIKFHNSYYLLAHQLKWGILPGIVLGFALYHVKMQRLRQIAPLLLLFTIVLLSLVFYPGIGLKSGGAQRWINIFSISIQPSEILKLTFILYLASWLFSKTEKVSTQGSKKKQFKDTLIAFLVVVSIVGLFLIAQPDLSTFGIIALTAFCMYFLSDTPLKHSFLIVLLGAIGLLALIWLEPYRVNRFVGWMFPELDPMGNSFQPNQALITAGSGGAFGQGFGASSQSTAHIPELIGDSVFAPYALETGFAGCLILILLFLLFIWRCVKIAKNTSDKFSRLTVLGVTFWIAIQAFVNIASTIRLIPSSGVPLPFISYGGTALMVELVAVAIILNISRQPE